jgi:hypothetical protein
MIQEATGASAVAFARAATSCHWREIPRTEYAAWSPNAKTPTAHARAADARTPVGACGAIPRRHAVTVPTATSRPASGHTAHRNRSGAYGHARIIAK